jgi:hypothetical protein
MKSKKRKTVEPSSPTNLYEEVFFLLAEEEYEAADLRLQTILAGDPKNGEAILSRCELLCHQNQFSEAMSFVKNSLDKDNPYYFLAIADTYLLTLNALGHDQPCPFPDLPLDANNEVPTLEAGTASILLLAAFNACKTSYDALSKASLICCLHGAWSLGITGFMIAAAYLPKTEDWEPPVYFPTDTNELAEQARLLDTDSPAQIEVPALSRIYVLLQSIAAFGIPEAGMAAAILVVRQPTLYNAIATPRKLSRTVEQYIVPELLLQAFR